jgi:predicted nucleic acid-binding protein
MGPGMIVVDTNVIVSVVVRGTNTTGALAARARDNDWIAPSLLRSELLNALSKYVSISGSLDRDDAAHAFRRGSDLVSLESSAPDPVDIFNLIIQSGITSYDAEFVALANERRVRLLTLDGKVLAAYPNVAVSLADFVAGK